MSNINSLAPHIIFIHKWFLFIILKKKSVVLYYSLFLFTLPPPRWHKLPPPVYLNGLILFSDKTPHLFAPATYIYNVYGVVACWLVTYVGVWLMSGGCCSWYSPYGGFCSCGSDSGWGARGGGDHSMRSAKKNPRFYRRGGLFVAVWRREWQRFQTRQFLRSLNLARRSNIIFSLHFYKST